MQNSVVQQNMAYIKDFLIDANNLGSSFLKPNQIQFSDWENQSGQLNFKICNLRSFVGQYLMQQMTDPYGEFDDLEFAAMYEAVSPILIVSNKGPVLFKNNFFSENIGTLGGSVHIYSPDFESNNNSTSKNTTTSVTNSTTSTNATNTQPYVYFSGNQFLYNMAYFAGNAIYMTHTVYRETDFKDHLYMCGAGVHIENNLFYHNVGLKRHNGGASMHRCQVYNSAFKQTRLTTTSSLELAQRNKTEADTGNFTVYYDDPLSTYDSFEDLYDSKVKYKLMKYATHIKYNNFTGNAAGMKGSALVVSFINSVEIEDNTFFENRPMNVFQEVLYSPYFKYFSLGQKTISLNAVPKFDCAVNNEVSYIQYCYSDLQYIDLPAIRGALYLEQCEDDYRCFTPVGQTYVATESEARGVSEDVINEEIAAFITKHQVSAPIMNSEVRNNVFDGNQNNGILTPQQT